MSQGDSPWVAGHERRTPCRVATSVHLLCKSTGLASERAHEDPGHTYLGRREPATAPAVLVPGHHYRAAAPPPESGEARQ